MKQVIQRLIDDLDPTRETDAQETVRFSLDGVDYEIDLSEENASALREALGRYVLAATKVGRSRANTTKSANGHKPSGTSAADRQRNAAIRQWATEQGMEVTSRGRIPGDIVRAYELRAERAGSAELVKPATGDGAKPAKAPGAARRAAKGAEKSAEATPKPDPRQGTAAQRRELSKAVRAYWGKHRKNVPAKGTMPSSVWQAYEQQDPSLLPSSR